MYSTTGLLDFCQKKKKKFDSFLLGMHFSVAVASVQQHVGHIKVRNFKGGILSKSWKVNK